MSENKRDVNAIRGEYTQLCAKAGHLQYQIKVLSDDLDMVNNTLRDLNFEAAAAAQKADEAKTEEKKAE